MIPLTNFRLSCLALLLAVGLVVPTARADDDEGHRLTCAQLTRLRFEGNTTVSAATEVTNGTITTPTGQVITGLPPFCRVQGLGRPPGDPNIYFAASTPLHTWHRQFLSSGQA